MDTVDGFGTHFLARWHWGVLAPWDAHGDFCLLNGSKGKHPKSPKGVHPKEAHTYFVALSNWNNLFGRFNHVDPLIPRNSQRKTRGKGISSLVSFGFSYCFLINFVKKSYSHEKKLTYKKIKTIGILIQLDDVSFRSVFNGIQSISKGVPMVFLWFLKGL